MGEAPHQRPGNQVWAQPGSGMAACPLLLSLLFMFSSCLEALLVGLRREQRLHLSKGSPDGMEE